MNLTFPSVCIINGAQRQGKSTCIRYIMGEYKEKFKYGIIFSNTLFSSEENYDYVPNKYIHPQFQEDKLIKLMEIQRNLPEGQRPLCFIIFDDCLFGEQWRSNNLKQLVTQVAHYNCFIIISTQYPQAIPSLVRSTAFFCIIFGGLTGRNAMKALYESYGMVKYNNMNEFTGYVIENTGDYKFIFINHKDGKKFRVLKCPANIGKFHLDY